MYYKGDFTAKIDGQDIPARLYIYTEDTGEPDELTFGAEPVTITWDDAGITDVIHRSQLEVRLVATEDGQYRDISSQSRPVYCHLYIEKFGALTRWWSGVYASTTLSEPFSREKNYELSVTFSDFGKLKRTMYDGTLDTAAGLVEVMDFLVMAFGYFLEDSYESKIEAHNLVMTGIGSDTLPELMIRDRMFYKDGEPRSLLDILTDILEPTNTHVIQYDGKMHLFCPDYFTAESSGIEVSHSLKAGGTDAELETCESYRRIELDYDRGTGNLFDFSPDMDGFIYSGNYADISEDGDGSAVLAVGSNYVAPGTPLTVAGGDNLSASMILLMTSGLSWPGGSKPSLPESISGIRYTFPETKISIAVDGVASPSAAAHRIRLDVAIFAVFSHEEDFGLYLAELPVKVKFTGRSGSVQYLKENTSIFSPSRFSWGSGESTVSVYLQTESPDMNRYGQFTLSLYMPDPGSPGKIEVTYMPTSFRFTDSKKPWGESGNEFRTTVVNALGLVSIKAEPDGYFDSGILSQMERVREDIADTDSDVFSKSFAMGTPVSMSIDTISNFEGYGAVSADSTFLVRYADFLKRNFAVTEDSPARRKVKGTYMFNHLLGLPVFITEECTPLKTLSGYSRAFFIRSEQWNVRSGMSDLQVEEANAEYYEPYVAYIIAIPSSLSLDAAGTAVQAVIRASGTSWNLAGGPNASATPTSGQEGDTTISVSMTENTALKERTSYIVIRRGASSVEETRIALVQAPGEPYLTLDPLYATVQWGEQPAPTSIDTNMPELTVTSTQSRFTGTVSEDGKSLQIHIEHNPGGRDDGAIVGYVDVAGKDYPDTSVRVLVLAATPRFRLDALVEAVDVPAGGGSASDYAVQFRTNASSLHITAAGTLFEGNDFWLWRRNDSGASWQTVKQLVAGDNSITLSGDPGKDEMLYFRIAPSRRYAINAGSQKAAAFSVTASAPDEEDLNIPLIIAQDAAEN